MVSNVSASNYLAKINMLNISEYAFYEVCVCFFFKEFKL